MSDRPINFYFLSTGYSGTRFYHHLLSLAPNAEVWHQPGHEEICDIVALLEGRFVNDPRSCLDVELTDFPTVQRRIDKRLALPWVYGDTLNWMRGLAYMLHKYIGPDRLRLVQLIRHPLATCRSMMAMSERSVGAEWSDISLAEQTARHWVRQYSWIGYQFAAINNDAECKTIRLEDTSLALAAALYDFLGLDGFDKEAVDALLTNTAQDVRHFHSRHAPIPASREELAAVWAVCAELAAQYGYEEDERYYTDAPSRPPRATASATVPTSGPGAEDRPVAVKLLNHKGLGLIIECPSGIQYINQAGGPICFWLHAEGAFVPLAEGGVGTPGDRLFAHFHLDSDKRFMRSVEAADADFIDALLADSGFDYIKVNRSRLGKAKDFPLFAWENWDGAALVATPWEAWVPVKIQRTPYDRLHSILSGCESEQAVLVWENSN